MSSRKKPAAIIITALVTALILAAGGAVLGYRFARPPALRSAALEREAQSAESRPDVRERGPNGSLTVLLAGADGALTDSMMLLVVPLDGGVPVLVSIPRDIWFEGNKINALLASYGAEYWMKEIGNLLDIPIDHYIVIQMSAFTDAVDALGGVKVELDQKFEDHDIYVGEDDDGEHRFGLSLGEGRHELSGWEALAFARSRQTTSDFDRADRQQLIIDGVRRRFNDLSVRDVGALASLLRDLRDHVHTDIAVTEMVEYYRRFAPEEPMRRMVISTDNVLYDTYTMQLPEELRRGRHSAPEPDEPRFEFLRLGVSEPGENEVDLEAVRAVRDSVRSRRNPLFPRPDPEDEEAVREAVTPLAEYSAFRTQLYSERVARQMLLEQRGHWILRPHGENWALLQTYLHAFLHGYDVRGEEEVADALDKTVSDE